jgi:RNA-directed DNA polymerase
MGTKRQKNQLELAFGDEGRGEAPTVSSEGTEVSTASRRNERPASSECLMEEVVSSEIVKKALQRVRRNHGGPGVDEMTVQELPDHLRDHWPGIREQVLSGEYRPQPVELVEIPKPGGGRRKLGVPTVVDRRITG